jgi:toxin-antitoxin system PIN domain toxin
MILPDVNVLVYAHRPDSIHNHDEYAAWLQVMAESPKAFGLSEAVLSGFVRVVTNRKIFKDPTPTALALEFCAQLRKRPQARILQPGAGNWGLFCSLCSRPGVNGKLVADAWHAALALEYDCEWITCDSDFARFPGLRWRHPLGPLAQRNG